MTDTHTYARTHARTHTHTHTQGTATSLRACAPWLIIIGVVIFIGVGMQPEAIVAATLVAVSQE